MKKENKPSTYFGKSQVLKLDKHIEVVVHIAAMNKTV
jgi:hypothetical protein